MKRIILYCILLAVVTMIPIKQLDVGDLEPVQAVWLYLQGDEVVLQTDTKDVGIGESVKDALKDLEENCLGIIYLDTAEYLLVAEDAQTLIPELEQYLKGSVRVCSWDGKGSVEDAARYMDAHKIGCKLRKWDAFVKLPKLKLKHDGKM